MAILPRTLAAPAITPHAHAVAASSPLRRCTFRRVTVMPNGRSLPMYDVACTFPDRERAIPLGDVDDARPICAACTYQGIFRADED
jgi:hypothetical protein